MCSFRKSYFVCKEHEIVTSVTVRCTRCIHLLGTGAHEQSRECLLNRLLMLSTYGKWKMFEAARVYSQSLKEVIQVLISFTLRTFKHLIKVEKLTSYDFLYR